MSTVDSPKRNTEELILEAAHEVFVEKGLAGARMQEIADRAGINKALLHYYFRSKDKLFELIISRAVSVLLPRLFAILEMELSLFDKIRQLTAEYIAFISHNSFMPLFIVYEANRNPQFFFRNMISNEKSRFDAFRQQVADAVARGEIRHISANELLINIMSMVVFPFLAKPIMQVALGLNEIQFQQQIEQRRTEVAEFVIAALRP